MIKITLKYIYTTYRTIKNKIIIRILLFLKNCFLIYIYSYIDKYLKSI